MSRSDCDSIADTSQSFSTPGHCSSQILQQSNIEHCKAPLEQSSSGIPHWFLHHHRQSITIFFKLLYQSPHRRSTKNSSVTSSRILDPIHMILYFLILHLSARIELSVIW